jgi:DNA polymerase III subunit epsilon
MKREICFDTETTGFDPNEGHRLIEIGCVELIDGRLTERQCHLYLNPERDVPQDSIDIHGLTTDFLKDKPIFKEVAQNFLNFIGEDGILVAHNAQFDIKFINFELTKVGLQELKNTVIDTLALAKSKFPGQKNNLDTLCKRFGVDASKRVKHGALLDAELLASVYIELLGGAQDAMFSGSDILKSYNDQIGNKELFAKILKKAQEGILFESRKFDIDENELQAHKEFIKKNLKESLWEYDKRKD